MEKILCPTIHMHRQHDCAYVDVGTVCYTVSHLMFVCTLPYHNYFLRVSLVNICLLNELITIDKNKNIKDLTNDVHRFECAPCIDIS